MWDEIFKAGKQTDSQGRTRDFTIEDLDKIASSYNPAQHEAPVVIGHPKDNDPAWGWVQGLKRQGNILMAQYKDLIPEFVDMVKKGLFKKRSISLYPDLSLRHVGFLGAMPPAVKGLADVQFKGDEEAIYEFAAADPAKAAQEARAKKYGISIKDGGNVTKPGQWAQVPDDDFLDPVNYRYPCPDDVQTKAAAAYWGKEANKAQYSSQEQAIMDRRLMDMEKKFKMGSAMKMSDQKEEKMTFKEWLMSMKTMFNSLPEDQSPTGELPKNFSEAELTAKLEAAKKEAEAETRKKMELEFAEQGRLKRQEALKSEIGTWCESMVKSGQIAPYEVEDGLVEFMSGLGWESEIEFSEGNKTSPLDWFKDFIGKRAKLVNFGEFATRDKDVGAGNPGEKLTALTDKLMAENKDLSFGEAFLRVQAANPDLAREYQNELGK